MYVPPSLAKQTENGNLKQGGDGRAIAAICDHTCTLVKTLGTLRKLVTVVYCTPQECWGWRAGWAMHGHGRMHAWGDIDGVSLPYRQQYYS